MFTIQQSPHSDTSIINVLPCRIQHNGPAKVTKRHWCPAQEIDGSKTSYFRGRKLEGKTIRLPEGYTGIIAKSTDRTLPKQFVPVQTDDSDVEEEQEQEPVKILETSSIFEDVTVWDHDQMPTNEDPIVKGMVEWIAFAQAIHCEPVQEQALKKA